MEIKVLGGGCKNCKILKENVEKALQEKGISANIEKVEDFQKIMSYGVMSTPALVIDGVVKSSGRVLNVEEIKKYF